MNIGTLAVNIVATTEKFTKGIQSAQKMMGGFVKSMSAGAAAVTASFAGMLKNFESTGSELHDMALKTGVSVEQLSFLKYAAEQSSSSLEQVGKAFKEMQKQHVDPNEFLFVAENIRKIKDPTERAAEAMELFGKRSGTALLPMINDLPELHKKFEELGGGMTDRMAAAADKLGDSLGDLKLSMTNIGNTIAGTLAPAVVSATEFITSHTKIVKEWITQHESLVIWVAKAALVLGTVAPILWGINKGLDAIRVSIIALGAVAAIAEKHPILLALFGAAALGTAAYQHYSAPAAPGGAGGGWDAPTSKMDSNGKKTADNTQTQVQLTKEQNDLLKQLVNGKQQVQLAVAGVR